MGILVLRDGCDPAVQVDHGTLRSWSQMRGNPEGLMLNPAGFAIIFLFQL